MTDVEDAVTRLQAVLTPEFTAACRAELAAVQLAHPDPELARRIAALDAGDLLAVVGLDPDDGRDERSFSLHRLQPGAGERCRVLARTLTAGWCLEELLEQPRAELAGTVRETGIAVATGDPVPETGLWLSGAGCPNLLLAGQPAPEQVRAVERVEWDDGVHAYETVREPTSWRQLLVE